MARATLTRLCLMLLCASFAVALGGGLDEHIVLVPQWSKAPPASFAIIQPETGVPLQRFWIPVHAAITVFGIAALVLTWRQPRVRQVLAIGLAVYVVMRAWSGLFFIREMLAFQQIPTTAPPSPELSARVAGWAFWSWFREPLDVAAFICALLAWRRVDEAASGWGVWFGSRHTRHRGTEALKPRNLGAPVPQYVVTREQRSKQNHRG